MAITAWEASIRALHELRERFAEMDPDQMNTLRAEQDIQSALDGVGRELMRGVLQQADMQDQEILVNGVLHSKLERRSIDVHTSFGLAPIDETMCGRGKGYPLVAPL